MEDKTQEKQEKKPIKQSIEKYLKAANLIIEGFEEMMGNKKKTYYNEYNGFQFILDYKKLIVIDRDGVEVEYEQNGLIQLKKIFRKYINMARVPDPKIDKVFGYRVILNGIIVKTIQLKTPISFEIYHLKKEKLLKENPDYIIDISYYHQNKAE